MQNTLPAQHPVVDFNQLPQHESDNYCRCLLACIARAFENPAVQAEYERWLAKRREKEAKVHD